MQTESPASTAVNKNTKNIVEINGICSYCKTSTEILDKDRHNEKRQLTVKHTAHFCIITGSPGHADAINQPIENPVVHNLKYEYEQKFVIDERDYKEAVMRNNIDKLIEKNAGQTIRGLKTIETYLKDTENTTIDGFPKLKIKGHISKNKDGQSYITAKVIEIPKTTEKIKLSATCDIKGKVQIVRPENTVTGIYLSCDDIIIPVAVPNNTSLGKRIQNGDITKGMTVSVKGEVISRKYTDGQIYKNRIVIKPKTIIKQSIKKTVKK